MPAELEEELGRLISTDHLCSFVASDCQYYKRKPGTSCLFLNPIITFDSVQSAQRAKASLNGADIYSGCCTLKIEYAKVLQHMQLMSIKKNIHSSINTCTI